MHALIRLAEEASHESETVPPWVFGAVTLALLLVALFVVTRFDPNR